MGSDKSLLPINGNTMIEHIIRQLNPLFGTIIIGANDPARYGFLNLQVVADIEEGKGPLMGILSCLKASPNKVNFVTACDIPNMNLKLIEKMLLLSGEADAIIPVNHENQFEPLFAVYCKSVIPAIESMLDNKNYKVIDLAAKVKTRFIDFEKGTWYENLNQKADYLDFLNKRNNGFDEKF